MNIFGATKDITFYGFEKCPFNKNIENIAKVNAGTTAYECLNAMTYDLREAITPCEA
jgi:hypothetical protein